MKKIKRLVPILLIILLGVGFNACTKPNYDIFSTITGKILDSETMQPIENVSVNLSPSGKNAVTDANGAFTFEELDAVQYTVSANKTGYNTNRKIVNAVAGETEEITILLTAQ